MRAHLEAEIDRAIERAEGKPFRWGRDDCMLWCANILKRALKVDPAKGYRGKYHGMKSAYREVGPGGLALAVRRACREAGWPPIDPIDAEAGDLGVIQNPMGQACVLYLRGGFWVGRIDRGVAVVPTKRVKVAWRVT